MLKIKNKTEQYLMEFPISKRLHQAYCVSSLKYSLGSMYLKPCIYENGNAMKWG
jgi:hypothetical protein